MIYFEFNDRMVDIFSLPPLGFRLDRKGVNHNTYIRAADRVFYFEKNVLIELKNRNGAPGTMHISDEDKIVLKLKAVLI